MTRKITTKSSWREKRGNILMKMEKEYSRKWRINMVENCRRGLIGGMRWHGTKATTGTERTKIVDKISDKKVPGFCFAPILKVLIDGEWKYDSELSDEDSWKAYWNIQAETIKSLLSQCPL